MSGNVWEWCADWHAPYTADAQNDPTGPETGTERIIRGGSFLGVDVYNNCEVVNRAKLNPLSRAYPGRMVSEPVGLRLAASVRPMMYNSELDYNEDGKVDIVDVNEAINLMLQNK